MSGFAGILALGDTPPDLDQLERMAQEVAYRGRDGTAAWNTARLALIHHHYWTTPEESGQQQPINDGNLALCGDLRLDNRPELIHALSEAGIAARETDSDAELVLAAFRCWNVGCLPRLIGDFALALWDADKGRLLLARDPTGMRPLYYGVKDQCLFFASNIRALRAVLSPLGLNHHLIWNFLNNEFRPWVTGTVWSGIHRVPPAHVISASPDGLQQQLYYRFGSSPPEGMRQKQDWVDGFRNVLDQALEARLRSRTPVAMMVSGGLDSSALACSAHALAPSSRIQLHSAQYQRTPSADEWKYFESVARACLGFETVPVPADDFWALKEAGTDGGFPLDEPELSLLRSHSLGLLHSAARHGCGVVITGEGANQILCHGVYPAAPLLSTVGWLDVLGEFGHFQKATGAPTYKLLFYFLQDRLPRAVKSMLLDRYGGRPVIMPWLDGPCPMGDEHAEVNPAFWTPQRHSALGRHVHRLFRGAFDMARYQALDLLASHAGVEWRAPFLDRRVVEFMLHVPDSLFFRRGQDRLILRQSMQDRLPEEVRLRPGKSYVTQLYHRGLRERERKKIGRLLTDSNLQKLPYVDVCALQQHIRDYWNGRFEDHSYVQRPLALEIYFRDFKP